MKIAVMAVVAACTNTSSLEDRIDKLERERLNAKVFFEYVDKSTKEIGDMKHAGGDETGNWWCLNNDGVCWRAAESCRFMLRGQTKPDGSATVCTHRRVAYCHPRQQGPCTGALDTCQKAARVLDHTKDAHPDILGDISADCLGVE